MTRKAISYATNLARDRENEYLSSIFFCSPTSQKVAPTRPDRGKIKTCCCLATYQPRTADSVNFQRRDYDRNMRSQFTRKYWLGTLSTNLQERVKSVQCTSIITDNWHKDRKAINLDSFGLGVFQSLHQFNIVQHVPLRRGQLTKKSVLEILQ